MITIKLKNLDSSTVNRNPTSNNDVENEKYVDDSIEDVQLLDSIKHYKIIQK